MRALLILIFAGGLFLASADAQVVGPGQTPPACTSFGTAAGTCLQGAAGLGTPSSGNAANITGLPILTGVSGLGTGVATLLTGAASGTGGPAGTAAPTFTGTLTGSVISATSALVAPVMRGGSAASTALIIESTSIAGTTDSIAIKTGSQVTGIGMDTNQLITLPRISSDATHTDAAVCEDTTSHAVYSGSGTLGVCLGTSSARYKTGILPLAPGLAAIMALKPKMFYLDKAHGDPKKQMYGFIAEDMVKVLPKLVTLDKVGRPNTADYLGVVPVLVNAMQQQQDEITALKAQNISLKTANVNFAMRLVILESARRKLASLK